MASNEDNATRDDTERDLDRNVDSALEGLRASASEAAPPTLDPELDRDIYAPPRPRPARPRRSSGGHRWQTVLMAAVALVGIAFVAAGFWPEADTAPGSAAAVASPAPAGPAASPPSPAAVALPDASPRTEPVDRPEDSGEDDALRRRLASQEQRVLALVRERDAALARVAELERALAAVGEQRALAAAATSTPREPSREGSPPSEPVRRLAAPSPATTAPVGQRPAPRPGTSEAAGGPARTVAADAVIPGSWTVALMTLSTRESADAFSRRVQANGWPADIREVGARGGLFRISSGSFGSRGEADAHGRTLAAALDLDSIWVVRRPGG